MGTHLGHSALYCLCQILQTPDFKKDVALIRGAVFFVGKLKFIFISTYLEYQQNKFSLQFCPD